MNIAIGLINIALLSTITFLWWRKIESLKLVFLPALIARLASGVLLGVLYKYYYSVGDTFGFFQDGVTLSNLAVTDFSSYLKFLWNGDESFPVWSQLVFQQPRALFLTKLVSVVNLVTTNNYWITSLYFSFLSFAATWSLVSTVNKYFPKASLAVVISFLFFPSVVFWSSGIIKECLALASLCFLSMIFVRLWVKDFPHILEWILGLWAIWILWNLKYYFAAVFIPVVFTSYVVHTLLIPALKTKSPRIEYLLWMIVFLIPLSIASFVHPNFYPERFLEVIVSNNRAFQLISNPEDLIQFNNLSPDGLSVLYNTPLALLSGFFRPFLWESGNLFQFIVAFENLILMVLFLAAIPQLLRITTSSNRLLILSLIIYSVFLCVFITLSTPNFGTLSRYRIGYIPYFALLIMINNPLITRLEKFLQRF